MSQLIVKDHPTGARVEVRVKPKSSRTAIVAVSDGLLVVSLCAPPVEGQANAELTRTLAKWLKVPPSSVTVQTGDKSRNKLLNFATLSARELEARLMPLCPVPRDP